MQLWQDGLIAMLAAVGLASLMWAAVKAVLYPAPPRRPGTVALIPAQGDGESLEQQLRALRQIQKEKNVFGIILLVDCGLSEEGRKLSRLLAREDRSVALCRQEEIEKYLNWG